MTLKIPYMFLFFIVGMALSVDSHSMESSYIDILTFETKRTLVKPLRLKHLEEAKSVDDSDASYVEIMADLDDVPIDQILQKQEATLENRDINYARSNLVHGILYCGVFLKEDNSLIGLVKIGGFYQDIPNEKHLLFSDIKYHKDHQGQGFATEVAKGLLQHYQTRKLIPCTTDDIKSSPFRGFHGLVHLTNKASLKCTLNSGYRLSRLFGDRVEFSYPFVLSSPQPEGSFFPPNDEKLHDDIKETLGRYLSREGFLEETERAEEALRKASLQNLMSVNDFSLETALDSESSFVVVTLAKFPLLFKDFADKLPVVQDLLLKQELPPEMDIPDSHMEQYRNYTQNLEKAKENIGNLLP
jgi:RimJ/RimL family protein N-acetyltransferase